MIFVLDVNELTAGVLSNDNPGACPYERDKWVERLNDALITYEFYIPMDHETAEAVKEDGYIIRQSPSGQLLMLQIIRVEEENADDRPMKYVYCENSGLELLGNYVDPADYSGQTVAQALSVALDGTRWSAGQVDWLGHLDLNEKDYKTTLAIIHDIAENVGGEIQFRVEINGGQVVGRYVDILTRRGRETGKRFAYSYDLKSVKRIADRSTVATAIIPIGKGDADSNPLTIESVAWSKANGDPVDKPLSQKWIGDDEARIRWGNGGYHIFKLLQTEMEDPAKLIQAGWDELQIKKEASVTYETGVLFMQQLLGTDEPLMIGDGVGIFDPTFIPELVLSGRIMEISYSFTDPQQSELVLGNYRIAKSNINEMIRNIQSTLIKNEVSWMNGGTMIATGPTPPDNPAVDDFWMDTSNETLYVLKKYNGTTWIPASPSEASQIAESSTRKWAGESGADVTGNNTAQNTEYVGNTSASTVEQKANNAIQQNTAYTNGWSFNPTTGITILRSDQLVQVVQSATAGIKIQKRASTGSPWTDVLYIDTEGNLKVVGDIVGGSINVDTIARVGEKLYLQWEGGIGSAPKELIFYENLSSPENDSKIYGTSLKTTVKGYSIDLTAQEIIDLYANSIRIGKSTGTINLNAPTYLNYPVYTDENIYRTNAETGYCGVGGMTSSTTTGACAGVGVNFRNKKNYTPSSVSLSGLSSNASPLTTQITADGFWLYLNGGGSDGIFRYWRGTYTA